ncbi:MAG TPA: HEAT repeat domain-containing protein, partial [Acidobacteriota bacterium]|nr:HEAT repeat domain-containing protein [Acidobacteriota bacterium]
LTDRVREILLATANTVSAMKIFPSEHASIRNFVEDLTKKMKAFLEDNGKLEIGIEEYVFTFRGKPIYRDELSIKSLPFFFFKDGMQTLFFYEGLETEEMAEFLELIRRESQKPAEDSDIVNAMWERDLPNIQYYAPDDYLENKITEDAAGELSAAGARVLPAELAAKIVDVQVDEAQFRTGKISVLPEDLEEGDLPSPIEVGALATGPGDAAPKGGAQDASLTDHEVEEIGELIHANRTISQEEEFLDLVVEIIYLEKDLDQFRASLDVMMEYHLDQLQEGNFQVPILIVRKVQDLRDFLAGRDAAKVDLLDGFLKTVVSERTLGAVKELFKTSSGVDIGAFFGYLKLLGERALPLAAEVYETSTDPEFRAKVMGFVRELDLKDLGTLTTLANDSRPDLSGEIIRHIAGSRDPKAPQYLAAFLGFQHQGIKLEAIHALGRFEDAMANKILAGFLKDADEELRVQAALRLKYLGDKPRLLAIILEASERSFRKRSDAEKQAIFDFLGRTRTDEAFAFLKGTLERRILFSSPADIATRLFAVRGLEKMATPAALDALRRGSRSRLKKLREECAAALIRLASAPGAARSEES